MMDMKPISEINFILLYSLYSLLFQVYAVPCKGDPCSHSLQVSDMSHSQRLFVFFPCDSLIIVSFFYH